MGAARRARATSLRLKSSKIFCTIGASRRHQEASWERCRGTGNALQRKARRISPAYRQRATREFFFEKVTSDLDDEQIDELLLTLRQRMIEARTVPELVASSDADGVGNEPEPRH